jgi:hypothetical protein
MNQDLARIKRNVSKMVDMGAPENEIDQYISQEGVTIEEIRSFNLQPQQNKNGTFGEAPEGFVLDPKTGQMVDTSKMASDMLSTKSGQIATGGAQFAKSYPILGAFFERMMGGGDDVQQEMGNQALKQFEKQNPKTTTALNIGGGIAGTIPMIAAAPTLMGASGSATLMGNSLNSLGSGAAIMGADAGIRTGGDLKEMGKQALIGGITGAAGPSIGRGIGWTGNAIKGAYKGIRGKANQGAANLYLNKIVERSGLTVEELAEKVSKARAAGNTGYTFADAAGHSGQRGISAIARTPGTARTKVVDALVDRQKNQGERITSFISDAFEAPDTAAQRIASLKAARKSSADINYPTSASTAKPVNLSKSIATIDKLLKRDPILGDSALSKGELGRRLIRIRDRLQKGGEQLIDYEEVLNVKSDLFRVMKKNPDLAGDLRPVYSMLDEALEESSAGYRLANDTYRQQSGVIDAVDMGSQAGGSRLRADDTIPQFNKLDAPQKEAFRVGYSDPLIKKLELANAQSATTNKAKGLLSGKAGKEIPEFVAPDKAGLFGQRIDNEQTMFSTANAALGGSKTSDNLADAAELAGVDVGLISSLLRGDLKGVAIQAGANAANVATGASNKTREMIAEALLETEPALIRQGIIRAIEQSTNSKEVNQKIIKAIMMGSSAGLFGTNY